ncbi:membrane protein [Streptomyces sp. Tu 6176]|uniref:hypothetical protein n=1 Tax=Streptomyces sp. Tu 6176 TaxID=1470557 RepID=UPI0004462969|nr:hypothetical protein [Streptomyces sp. Tu 6176]EYT79004.1 membrane protein [Streptomyces sp. Tu 6176]
MTDQPYEGAGYGDPRQGTPEGHDPYAHQQHGQRYQQQPDGRYDQYGQQHNQQYGQHQQYDQYGQQAAHPQQVWPGQEQQPYADPYAASQSQAQGQAQSQGYGYGQDLDHTQQWQGQTWDTQTHGQPVVTGREPAPAPEPAAARTAYLPPLAHPEPQLQPQPRPVAPAPAPADEGPDADPGGYGPATLGGNTRVTDAQRARAEGRSPIIDPGMQPAGLTALLGLLLAGAAEAGTYALLVPLVVLQAVTAAGWFRLNGMWPARQGIALAFAGALVSDAAVLGAGRAHAPAAILGTLGVWVLLSLVLQLRSHAEPDERMYGLMATVASAALAILATGYLGAGADAVAVGAVAVAAAVVARALPLPGAASVVVALLAAAGAGIAVGGLTGIGAQGALLGAGAGVCALVGHRVAAYDYPSRFVHFTAGVALPLSAAAPVVWLLGRALG